MNRSIIRRLVIAALVAYPVSALAADQAPDVKGKWIGKTHTILVGNGQLESGDMLSFCYMHTGGKSRSTVVSCTEVKRTR
jgi:hypothetical protein